MVYGQPFHSETSLEKLYIGPGEELVGPVSDIVVSIRKHYPRSEIDWKLIHDAGQAFNEDSSKINEGSV